MALERITDLSEPPVVGRFYLVPTVKYPWLTSDVHRPWPVLLPRHEDAEHLNFQWHHYHIDPRFLSRGDTASAADWLYLGEHGSVVANAEATAQRQALHRLGFQRQSIAHPPIVWRRRKCARATIEYQHGHEDVILKLGGAFSGRQCAKSRTGWICPHKRANLGSMAAVDGVITCPLHGLRINAETGVVL